ncbi:MAG: Ig-like domain-containing protein, partial [Cocleimonas sp.]
SLSVVSVDAGSLMYGTVMQSGNQVIYTPSNTCGKGNTGVDNFSYTITDGNGNTDSANVEVTVKGVTGGGKTQANADDVLIDAGETVTINVLSNDTGNGLKIIAVDNPTNGTATIVNNKIVYTPDAGFTGMDMFYYDIVDANGYNDSSSIIVDVIKGCPTGYKCN